MTQVGSVLLLDGLEMSSQLNENDPRQGRDPILVALASADPELAPTEVDVLHPEAGALQEAQTRAVQEDGHQPRHAVESSDDGAYFIASEDHGKSSGASGTNEILDPRHVGAENVPVEEQDGAEGLVLRGRGNAAVGGERAHVAGDLLHPHVARVALAVEQDEATDPAYVRFLRPPAVVARTDRRAHLVEQPRGRGAGCGREAVGMRHAPLDDGAPAPRRQCVGL
jgi:hypothetical protein